MATHSMAIQRAAWLGHYPITVFVLAEILNKWPGTLGPEMPRAERVLFIAASFWAAVNEDTLNDYFDSDIIGRLQNAAEAFTEIGARKTAAALKRHLNALCRKTAALDARQLATDLQMEFARPFDEVDELIARSARRLLDEGIFC